MPQDNLKHKAATGMIWTAVQRYSKIFISFFSGIILARLLMPEDYGAIGMLAIFMSLAEEAGLSDEQMGLVLVFNAEKVYEL